MKKSFFLLFFIPFLSSCSKDNSVAPNGVWKVAHYIDSGKDETSDFNGYTFDFQTSGKFVAKFSTRTTEGTWNENSSSKKLDIKISGDQKLDDISDDWLIMEKTSTSIKLKDDNASSNEEIHLVKL
jgi:hypothetical protein